MFAKYYLTYRQDTRFTDHTGYPCSIARVRILRNRLLALEKAYDKAKKEGDFATLAVLESGKFFKKSKK